jgi:L-cysteine S-thiosulfotransferase
MAKFQFCAVLLLAAGLCALVAAPSASTAGECKRKKAGFYLTETAIGGGKRLSAAIGGLPASLTGVPGDPIRGREVFANRLKGDCLSCHKLSQLSSSGPQGGIGPALDNIASKYNDGQLRQLLIEPKAYWPDTIMPAYFRTQDSAEASVLTAGEIEDLVAYMATLR